MAISTRHCCEQCNYRNVLSILRYFSDGLVNILSSLTAMLTDNCSRKFANMPIKVAPQCAGSALNFSDLVIQNACYSYSRWPHILFAMNQQHYICDGSIYLNLKRRTIIKERLETTLCPQKLFLNDVLVTSLTFALTICYFEYS